MAHEPSKTILHLIETSEPGGAEKILLRLVESLDRARYRSVVCLLREGWLSEELRDRGVRTVVLPLRSRLDPSWVARGVRLVREERVELLHAHEFALNTYGCMVARITGRPIVTTVHGRGYYGEKRHRRLAYRFVARSSYRMVAVSEDIRTFLVERVGVGSRNLVTIRNGIDLTERAGAEDGARLRRQLGIPEGAPVIGAVGSLLPVKGHTYLLRAAAEVARTLPDLVVVISGSPVLLGVLRDEAAALGIGRQVRFLGFRDDVPAVLRAMDVFVLPSLSEGLSLSLLEAMAAGLPVVATDVGGTPEIVDDGRTGFLVPARDPGALAQKIVLLLRDRALAGGMGDAGRLRVRRFSLDAMLRRYHDLYAAGLADRRRRAAG